LAWGKRPVFPCRFGAEKRTTAHKFQENRLAENHIILIFGIKLFFFVLTPLCIIDCRIQILQIKKNSKNEKGKLPDKIAAGRRRHCRKALDRVPRTETRSVTAGCPCVSRHTHLLRFLHTNTIPYFSYDYCYFMCNIFQCVPKHSAFPCVY
jgi:hypothetical protein